MGEPTKNKTSTLRDTSLVIIIVYLLGLTFNSQAIINWLEIRSQGQEAPSQWSQMFHSWHHSLQLFTLTNPRQRIRHIFHANIPLAHNIDDIGFNAIEDEAPKMDMLVLASSSTYWHKMNLGVVGMALADIPNSLDSITVNDDKAVAQPGEESILVIGDSIMGGIAPMIKRELRRKGHMIAPIINWKISSGLARSDYYNWPQVADHLIKSHKVDVVVALFGTNDPFKSVWFEKKSIAYSNKAWPEAYKERVRELQKILCQKAKTVYWLSLPPMRKPELDAETSLLNQIYKEVSNESSCVHYIATQPLLADDAGAYTTYRMIGKNRKKIREGDGIHLTQHGGQLVAQYILNQIDLDKEFVAH